MKTDADVQRRSVLLAAYRRRRNADEGPMPFDDLDEDTRRFLLDVIKLRDTELPVIGCSAQTGAWFVVSTQRVLWNSPTGEVHELEREVIASVGLDLEAEKAGGAVGRGDLRFLSIQTIDGRKFLVETDRGAKPNGTLSLLRSLTLLRSHS